MYIPPYILTCMNALEAAGHSAYVVGGCVRDACLGLTPHDYDMCTSALPEEIEAVFADKPLILNGKKHGTISVITSGDVVEITTYRTEGDYQDNRHPDWVAFVPEIEKDLARRDFTINAMAYSPKRGFADPYGGREDLKNRVLRAVGNAEERFQEDSLRILRGVRFSVRYGLAVDPDTEKAMTSQCYLMDNLARERVFSELCKLLPGVSAGDVVRFAPVFCQVIPELKPMVDFCQHSRHHAFDLYGHTAHTVAAVEKDLALRWAALLHDIGKPGCFFRDEQGEGHFYGHAAASAEMADRILLRLKSPTQLREQVVTLIGLHMTLPEPGKKSLRRRLSKLGQDTMDKLLKLQWADTVGTGVAHEDTFALLEASRRLLEEILQEKACLSLSDLAVNGHDMIALGYSGKEIGLRLNTLLELVMDEKLENNRDALLAAAAVIPLEEHQ